MNISNKDQKRINDFVRKYAALGQKLNLNKVALSGASMPHNKRLCDIGLILYKLGIPFFTEFKMKCGTQPDFCCPTHVKKFIEVFHTETMKSFNTEKRGKYPEELRDEFIFINTDSELTEEMVL